MGALHLVMEEVQALVEDVEGGKASIRDRTAAGAFLAQFYRYRKHTEADPPIYERCVSFGRNLASGSVQSLL